MDEDNHVEKSEVEQTDTLISFVNKWDFVVGLIPPMVMFVEWMLCKFSIFRSGSKWTVRGSSNARTRGIKRSAKVDGPETHK